MHPGCRTRQYRYCRNEMSGVEAYIFRNNIENIAALCICIKSTMPQRRTLNRGVYLVIRIRNLKLPTLTIAPQNEWDTFHKVNFFFSFSLVTPYLRSFSF